MISFPEDKVPDGADFGIRVSGDSMEPVYHDGGDPLLVMDQIGDEKNSDKRWLERVAVGEALKKIAPRENKIIKMRFFQGRTQMEVASEIGISQAQVSRLEKGAIEKLRKYME